MKRWLIGLGVFALFSAIAVSAHLYVIQRMVTDAGIGSPGASLAKVVVWSGFAAMFAQPFFGRAAPRWLARSLSRFASTWMALLFWLLVALGVSDALLAIILRQLEAAERSQRAAEVRHDGRQGGTAARRHDEARNLPNGADGRCTL